MTEAFLFLRLALGRCGWKHRRYAEQIVQRVALHVSELAAVLRRVHVVLPLGCRHIAQTPEGPGDCTPAVFRQTAELLHGSANLLTLRRRETLHRFRPGKDALLLIGRHTVQLGEPVVNALLLLRLELPEAGLIIQRVLLLGQGQVAVGFYPIAEVLLAWQLAR
jgi:hypothetical protein